MKRTEIESKYKWHLNDMVADDAAFESAFADIVNALPQIEAYKGKLANRVDALACLKLDAETSRKFEIGRAHV